jgi:hypothetical protein
MMPSGARSWRRHGMVFMIIDTNTAGDSVLQRKAAELDALESLKGEQMGGAGAWLNGFEHPEIRTVVTLRGHHATAGGAEPLRGLPVPTLMLAGTAATTILGLGMSQPV